MAIVLILQNFFQYSGAERLKDNIGDDGFYIILALILMVFLFTFRDRNHNFHWLAGRLSWVFAALGCWWLFFREDSGSGT